MKIRGALSRRLQYTYVKVARIVLTHLEKKQKKNSLYTQKQWYIDRSRNAFLGFRRLWNDPLTIMES